MACRDQEKGRAAAAPHYRTAGGVAGALDVMVIDLADLASVRSFADAFHGRFDRLDLLINNAGGAQPVAAMPVRRVRVGHECYGVARPNVEGSAPEPAGRA